MKVSELKELIEGVNGDVQILIPMSMEFDGTWYSPCSEDSGLTKVGTGEWISEEDEKEMLLLGKEIPEEDAFLLMPCGFGEEKDHKHTLN